MNVDSKKPFPPGGVAIYDVPSSRTWRKRSPHRSTWYKFFEGGPLLPGSWISVMVIPFAIRGMAFANVQGNVQGIVVCLPFPMNSHSHSNYLKIPLGGRGVQSWFSRKNWNGTPTHIVTEIRDHCSEGGKGWGLSSSLVCEKKTLNLERLEHLKLAVIFGRNLPLRGNDRLFLFLFCNAAT